MSTSKYFDRVCAAVVVLGVLLTVLFMNGSAFGIQAADRVLGYEGRLFDPARVHTVDLVVDDWEGFLENCENEEYVACAAVIDGESYKNVALRAKGNTSLSSVRAMDSSRYSFKLEFDHFNKNETYHGLDKLCLNNIIQDKSYMKDYLTYRLMEQFGVDAPLCSYVWITVNGEDWGLYLAVEGVEDSFLQRNYGNDGGELYKPDSMGMGGGRGNGREFDMDAVLQELFGENVDVSELSEEEIREKLESAMPQPPSGFPGGEGRPGEGPFAFGDGGSPEPSSGPTLPADREEASNDGTSAERRGPGGERGGFPGGGFGMGSDDVKLRYIDDDPDSYSAIFGNAKTVLTESDKARLIASLKQLSEQTALEDVLDIDEVLRYFVVHNFVVNGDSYTGSMIHNYYLHESDGKLAMIPWDYNLAFGSFQGGNAASSVNASIDNPVSGSLDDRPMVGWIFSDAAYTEQYHSLFAAFLEQWFGNGELEALINRTAELIRPYVEKDPTRFCTTEEFEAGVEALTQFVTLRGEAVSRQLAGDDSAVETGDLNLSDLGSMGGGTGGGPGGFTPPARSDAASGENGEASVASESPSSASQPSEQNGQTQRSPEGQSDWMPTRPQGQSGQMPMPPNGQDDQMPTPPNGQDDQMPTPPNGQDGQMPTPPNSQNGQMPTAPDGQSGATPTGGQNLPSFQPPDAQSGQTQTTSEQPDGDGTTPTEERSGADLPSDQSVQAPTMPGQGSGGEQPQPPAGGGSFSPADAAQSEASESTFWLLVCASTLVLVLGIVIAVKKKY